MNDTSHEPEEKLDAMLRRWGAEQAAQDARWAARHLRGGPGPMAWLRTAAVAAAAVVVAVTATILVAGMLHDRQMDPARDRIDKLTGQVTELSGQVQTLTDDLAGARSQIESVRSQMAGAAARHQEQMRTAETERSTVQAALDDLQKQLLDKQGEHVRQLETERAKLAESDRKLEAATTRLAEVQKSVLDLQTASGTSATKIADMQTRLAAAGGELMLLNEKYEKEVAARMQAEQRVAGLQTEVARLSMRAREGPDGIPEAVGGVDKPSSWQERKRQARQAQLLVRAGRLRPTVGQGPARALMDRLEVLLTRLELLEVNDPGQVRSFVGLIQGSNLPAEIDSILASAQLTVPVRSWLLEARALLAENHRVG